MTDIINEIIEKLPSRAQITSGYLEGATIILFSKNFDFFMNCLEDVKKVVKEVKKRIEVRADSSLLLPPEETNEKIKKLIPEEAGLGKIEFDPVTNKVIIECDKPGKGIGKGASVLLDIKKETRWTPEILRTPPLKSDIIESIRNMVLEESKSRKEFLNKLGKIICREGKDPYWVRITALGGAREVGRSCYLLQTPESRILIDCGVNVALPLDQQFPLFDAPEFNINSIDAVIISHAHLDHCGALPALFKFGYKGPVYCTKPTTAIMSLLQLDYINVIERNGQNSPYSSKEVKEANLHAIKINYGEVTDIAPDIKLVFHNAGHIIGSSTVHLHIGEGVHNIVYTGDIKFGPTKLLDAADNKFPRCETMIVESTYGGAEDIQQSRQDSEAQLVDIVKKTIKNKGKLLIPVLGVGRSQEIMMILEEKMRNKEIPEAPIFIDGMVWDATAITTAYPEFLNSKIRSQIFGKDENPFLSPIFKRVKGQQERNAVIEGGPCIILATSGMLTGGASVEYLKTLADNPRNSLCFTCYQAEGSLGKRIQNGRKEIPVFYGGKTQAIKIEMNVSTIAGFSGHSDRRQLMAYVGNMSPKPRRVLVVHGEERKCLDLARSYYKTFRVETDAVRNLDAVRLV